jgi:hypothetical protein
MLLGGITFWSLFSICMPIWYRIEERRGCVTASDTYFPLFYAIYNLTTIIGPLLIMLLFNVLILINIRRLARPGVTSNSDLPMIPSRTTKRQRKDLQLLKLSLTQAVIYILLTSLYAYTGTYNFFTRSIVKSREQTIIDTFLSNLGILLMYLYMGVGAAVRLR